MDAFTKKELTINKYKRDSIIKSIISFIVY